MARPEYCPVEDGSPNPCPACGATEEGNDPVRGVCQARRPYPPPVDYIRVVLVDRLTGKEVE